jgi:hypothetical protein
MKKKRMWLTYDLGLRGDYESLYAWLDTQNAKECGDNAAFLVFSYKRDFIKELKKSLFEAFEGDNRTRIYLVYRSEEKDKPIGVWLKGNRKSPPWTGFGMQKRKEVDA